MCLDFKVDRVADQCCSWQRIPDRRKGKGSSFDLAPLIILDSGALQPRKWQLIDAENRLEKYVLVKNSDSKLQIRHTPLTSERLKFLSWATGQLLSIHIEHHHTPDALPDENNTAADIAALRARASNASAYAQQACPLALAVQASSAPC